MSIVAAIKDDIEKGDAVAVCMVDRRSVYGLFASVAPDNVLVLTCHDDGLTKIYVQDSPSIGCIAVGPEALKEYEKAKELQERTLK